MREQALRGENIRRKWLFAAATTVDGGAAVGLMIVCLWHVRERVGI